MSSAQTTAPAPAAPIKAPGEWRKQLGVLTTEHAAVLSLGGWDETSRIPISKYRAKLTAYRKGPA